MQQKGHLLVALGRDTAGAPVVMDMARAPHLLIAGATGAGKSICINAIVTSLLMQHSPETLRLIMVDPKRVELTGYNGIPHLLGPVITDVDQVMGALIWLLLQMDDRYRAFREVGARNIDSYNRLALESARKRGRQSGEARGTTRGAAPAGRALLAPLPYIVLIIDEMADLMMTAEGNIEREVCRLAQMARATGIHLILATQRPSIDVVTGTIKANFPTRIAFAVSSQIDSRVILDAVGAERLLGRGDMLLMRPDAAKLFRCQGCFVADDEIRRVTDFWKATPEMMPATAPWQGLGGKVDKEDELVQEAIDVLRGMRTCSASLLQRRLGLGHPKAARLIDRLEEMGVVGPDLGGGKGREVLLNEEREQEMEAVAQGEW
jgi:S-DNA-T family DNA segregation ATPase FtsK/SpoIIIE